MIRIRGGTIFLRREITTLDTFTVGRLVVRIHKVMAAAKGSWVSDDRFSATIDEIGLVNLWKWDLHFQGDTVTFFLESLAGGELPATVSGRVAR